MVTTYIQTCVYIYIYISLYVFKNIYMYIYIYLFTYYNYIYIYVYIYICMNVWMYECMNVCMYECMNVWMYECMNVWMYECMNVCMYVCMYVCMLLSLTSGNQLSLQTFPYQLSYHADHLLTNHGTNHVESSSQRHAASRGANCQTLSRDGATRQPRWFHDSEKQQWFHRGFTQETLEFNWFKMT